MRFRAICVIHNPSAAGPIPATSTFRVDSSITNSTTNRWSPRRVHTSTGKKSAAMINSQWRVRNSFHVVFRFRSGAGSMPFFLVKTYYAFGGAPQIIFLPSTASTAVFRSMRQGAASILQSRRQHAGTPAGFRTVGCSDIRHRRKSQGHRSGRKCHGPLGQLLIVVPQPCESFGHMCGKAVKACRAANLSLRRSPRGKVAR